ncbi:SphA family protein [Lysobacter arvi]|uniref:Transporter n=1 Tax=Lysobacter arvi TaxID=3038776 RepID=A0ABU1CFY5_9GAMM|nr:transporter [Lysobacter arvi]MDR0183848.1 transporter [Lysobacter arvi]
MNTRYLLTTAIALGLSATMPSAFATEGGLGRTITGTNVQSFAGVVPPTPGFNAAVGYVHYSGEIGASREVPVNNLLTLGMDATFDMLSVTGLYVWDTGESRWNFASLAALPFATVEVNANVALGPRSGQVTDKADWDVFDPFFVPVIAGYHFDQTHHMTLALYVYTDWGDYDPNRLANLSLNTWTYSPTIGYTQLTQQGTLEFTTVAAVDFYTKNDATDYQNGAVFRLDAQLMKRFASGWGVGGIGGWIQQLEDDEGPLADRLDGFKGHSFALGPTVDYTKKWDGGEVVFAARWLKEFDVKRRVKGDPLMVTATVAF